MSYYCTYCDYYSRNHFTGQRVSDDVFIGTRREVERHALAHPIGDPRDMSAHVSTRAPYEGEAS